jgi:hypothetical protein
MFKKPNEYSASSERNRDIPEDSPVLASLPVVNPFIVPEHYFEGLPSEVLDKCMKLPDKQGVAGTGFSQGIMERIFILLKQGWLVSFIVIVTGLLFILNNINHATNGKSYEALLTGTPDSVIYNHLYMNVDEVSVNNLAEVTLDKNEVETGVNTDADDSQVENYLINQSVETTDIENEM